MQRTSLEIGFRDFAERMPDAVLIVDGEGSIVLANGLAKRLLGYTRKELAGMSVDALVPEPLRAAHARRRADYGADPQTRPMGRGLELIARRKDGTEVPVEISLNALPSERGLLVVCAIRDVSERQQAEAEIRLAEARYRSLVERLPLVTYMVTLEQPWQPAYVSPQIEALLGFSPFEWLAEPGLWLSRVHPDDRERLLAETQRAVTAAAPFRSEYRLLAHDGRAVWVRDEAVAVHDDTGRPRLYQGFLVDVTERKTVEEALRETSQILASLIESSPTAIIAGDVEGNVVMWNPAAERIYGWRAEEVLGRPLPTVPEGRGDEYRSSREAVLRGEAFSNRPARRRRKDSSLIDVSLSKAPLRAADGRITGAVGVSIDVTEQRHAEEALRQSEASLARAQEIAHLGNWDWDVATGELRWSDGIYRVFGLEPQEFDATYEAFLAHVHPDDRELVQREVDAAIAGRRLYSGVEHRVVRPDGAVRIVREDGVISRDESGRPVRMVGTVQDITERRQLEEQLRQSQKLEAIGRLAGGIAHDFNNLLTAIFGYTEFTLQQLDEKSLLRRDIEEISKAAGRAESLVRQLLAFSRRQELQPRVLDLNATVRDMEAMLGRLIGEDIELVTTLDPDLAPVRADPSHLEQVILNLAINGRDAMPAGGRLTIETRNVVMGPGEAIERDLEPGPHVALLVQDTGVGIDDETRSRLFEPFFTTKEPGSGTGLGLATVYGAVKQSRGAIAVGSTPGEGATFTIFLPCAEEAPGTPG